MALITGEEKIVPPSPSYYVCTVESMPLDRPVDFLAVDEIQLCGDAERGHVFTDRLLHARGVHETMLLGSDTIRPLLRRLVPEAEISSRPRFSTLRYTGAKKLTRLPPPERGGRLRRGRRLRARRGDAPAPGRHRGGDGRACRPARATPRWACSNRARSITWWRPTPSAWASTWIWTMSPSRASLSSTASRRAGWRLPRSRRSPAAPDGT